MFKTLNTYSIVHKDGQSETLSAETMEQAIENMSVSEETSPVSRALMTQSGVNVYVEDLPDEISFYSNVEPSDSGCIATPASGTAHLGDTITLQAIPSKNYQFDCWNCNGVEIGTDAEMEFVLERVTPPNQKLSPTDHFTAVFSLKPVEWTTAVSPARAGTAGCIAFPTSGTTEANASAEFLAVPATGYTFDHWERNGVSLSTNKLLQLDAVAPLADNETSAIYTAVFNEE